MFKKILKGLVTLGVVGSVLLTGTDVDKVEAWDIDYKIHGKCKITIDARKHINGGFATTTGPCKNNIDQIYGWDAGWDKESFSITGGSYMGNVKNGWVVETSLGGKIYELYVTTIDRNGKKSK